MADEVPEDVQRWTARQRAALVLSIVKECVWQHQFGSFADARRAIRTWIEWYNERRLWWLELGGALQLIQEIKGSSPRARGDCADISARRDRLQIPETPAILGDGGTKGGD